MMTPANFPTSLKVVIVVVLLIFTSASLFLWLSNTHVPATANEQQILWRGLILGKSSRADGLRMLGEPQNRGNCGGILMPSNNFDWGKCLHWSYMRYEEGAREPKNSVMVHLNADTVWMVEETYSDPRLYPVAEVVRQNGLPEEVLFSTISDHALLYCQQGFVLYTDVRSIFQRVYFPAMSMDNCRSLLSTSFTETPSSTDTLITKDPWGYTDPHRVSATTLLSMESTASWQEIQSHLDCQAINIGSPYETTRNFLESLPVSLDATAAPDTLIVHFNDWDLLPRKYIFTEGVLTEVQEPNLTNTRYFPVPISAICKDV